MLTNEIIQNLFIASCFLNVIVFVWLGYSWPWKIWQKYPYLTRLKIKLPFFASWKSDILAEDRDVLSRTRMKMMIVWSYFGIWVFLTLIGMHLSNSALKKDIPQLQNVPAGN
jgi:hypothetical protein